MKIFEVTARFITTVCLASVCAMGAPAQSQPDSQAGAQLGEQSALGGTQGQAANVQKTTQLSESSETSLAAGTAITAELARSLDSKKVKQDEAVEARTTEALKSADGRTILPRGTRITGHVTKASARSAGQTDSSLGLVFDQAILKSGQQIPLNVAIQAVGAPPSGSADVSPGPDAAPIGGSGRQTGRTVNNAGSPVGGAAGTLNNTSAAAGRAVDNTVNSTAGAAGAGTANNSTQLNANSRGVVGLNNLQLSANAGENSQGSVITSTGKNVHLDSGTRLLLVAQPSSNQPAQTRP
ncbi:MAG: hypothetical protein M3P45_09240 [Acidobacteriota bacterium]|nr:hypothetical protein [Acidobacteriota bacterium]